MAEWEFIGKATQFVAEEMGIALKKSAISPNIRERMDHSCAITDPTGMIVAQAEHIPVHLGSFRTGIKNIIGWMENHNIPLKAGDMLITNDPYISGTHMNDVAIMAPVYFNGEVVAYVANKAHNVDVGGPIFGSLNPNAKNLYQEGLVIPPVRIVKNNEIDQEIFSFILDNFKDPETATGDINAQIAANRRGIKRISELFSRFGKIQVIEGWKDLIEHSRKLSLQSISNWKMGKFSSVDYLEWGRETIKLQICLTALWINNSIYY